MSILTPAAEYLIEEALSQSEIFGKALMLSENGTGYLGIPKGKKSASVLYPLMDLPDDTELWVPPNIEKERWSAALEAAIDYGRHLPFVACLSRELKRVISGDFDALVRFTNKVDIADMLVRKAWELLIGVPIRQYNGKEYYFNNEGILCVRESSSQNGRTGAHPNRTVVVGPFNGAVWRSAAVNWEEGTDIASCIDSYLSTRTRSGRNTLYSFIDRLCTRIEKPLFDRTMELLPITGFDQIQVVVCLCFYMFPTQKELWDCVLEHRKSINNLVFEKIEEFPQYQRSGYTRNDFYISDVCFNPDRTLELTFRVKESVLARLSEGKGRRRISAEHS